MANANSAAWILYNKGSSREGTNEPRILRPFFTIIEGHHSSQLFCRILILTEVHLHGCFPQGSLGTLMFDPLTSKPAADLKLSTFAQNAHGHPILSPI